MDELIRHALAPVLRDLAGAAVAAPRIEASDWADDADGPSVMLWSPTGSGTGLQVSRSAQPSARIAWAADQLQGFVIEDLWGAQGPTNWPRCPHHPTTHPLTAAVHDDAAVWMCPVDDGVVATIGTLEPVPPARRDQ